ncbi:MAG: hypothetical protein ACRCZB_03020 [Bacteroidales bacterium]
MNIDNIKFDSLLRFADISPIVDRLFQVGEKKTIEVTPWHQTEKQEAYYYDFSLRELSDKEDYLEISKKEFLSIMCRWVQLNWEIKELGDMTEGIMLSHELKYEKNIEERDSLWPKIEKTFYRSSLAQPPALPNEIDTKETREVFKRAIENGYIDIVENRYKWNNSLTQFAYLINKLKDNLGRRLSSFNEVEELFNIKNINKIQRKYLTNKKTNGKPRGFVIIDALFENM